MYSVQESQDETQDTIQYKCGYCGWFFPVFCEKYTNHQCLSDFDEDQHQLVADENYALTIVSKDGNLVASQLSKSRSDYSLDEQIISHVSERPALFNYSLPIKERTQLKKNALWQEIYNCLEGKLTVEEIKNRWKYLRDCYMKAKKKVKEYLPSGSEGGKKKDPSFRFYEMMSFLGDMELSERTVSSVNIPSSSRTDNSNILNIPASTSSNQSESNTPKIKGKGLKRKSNSDDLETMLINSLNDQKPTGSEGFSAQVEEGLARLPYRKRIRTEIKILQLLLDADNE